MSVNEQLVRDTVRKIIEQAPHGGWDQRQFVSECGTSFCFAGWALRLSGYGIRTQQLNAYMSVSWFVTPSGTELQDAFGYSATDQVERAAMKALGFSFEQASQVFYSFTGEVEKLIETIEKTTGMDLSAEKAAAGKARS